MPFGSFLSSSKDKPRVASEVVAKAVTHLDSLSTVKPAQHGKALEAVAKYLGQMKQFLFGDDEHEPTRDNVISLAVEACKTRLLTLLVKHLSELEFESRKDAAQVFGAIVRIRDKDETCPGALYVQNNLIMLQQLFAGYDEPSVALNCGGMLRDCIRDEALARWVLESSIFLKLFDKLEVANFEVASDAFTTFKDLLTRHKAVVAQYLAEHYTEFFEAYKKLLQSGNYVTRRQSLKLLGELLLDRSNVKVMVKFVSEVSHLMQMMMLLKDQSRSIQFEAFHVFKVFVANPNKPQQIVDILTNNRGKLLKYLEEFHTDKDDDEQFKEEKAVIIKEISMLGPAQTPPQTPQAAAAQPSPQLSPQGSATPLPHTQQQQQQQQGSATLLPQQQQQPTPQPVQQPHLAAENSGASSQSPAPSSDMVPS